MLFENTVKVFSQSEKGFDAANWTSNGQMWDIPRNNRTASVAFFQENVQILSIV